MLNTSCHSSARTATLFPSMRRRTFSAALIAALKRTTFGWTLQCLMSDLASRPMQQKYAKMVSGIVIGCYRHIAYLGTIKQGLSASTSFLACPFVFAYRSQDAWRPISPKWEFWMRLLRRIKLSATWAIDWCEDNAWIQYLSSWSPPEPFLSKTSRLATLDNFVVHVSCPMSTYTCWLCTVTIYAQADVTLFSSSGRSTIFNHQMMRSPCCPCFNHQWIFHALFSEVQATTAPAHPMSWIVLLHWSWRYTPGLALNNLIPLSFKSLIWLKHGLQWSTVESTDITKLYQYYITNYHNMSRNDSKIFNFFNPLMKWRTHLQWVPGDDIRGQLVPERRWVAIDVSSPLLGSSRIF